MPERWPDYHFGVVVDDSNNNGIYHPQSPTHYQGYSQDTTDQPRPQSSMSRLSRVSRLSRYARTTGGIAVECVLRVVSAIVSSAVIAASAVIYVLIDQTPANTRTTVDHINWVIGIPLGGTALAWQIIRLGILATTLHHDDDADADRHMAPRMVADILAESLLAVGGVICSVLAAFQAARHAHQKEGGCEVALAVLIGVLAVADFGLLALSLVEENRRRAARPVEAKEKRARRRFLHSSDSSVIEIIRR